ncbi:unnamed protein product, partial [Rotaria sp. Silwood2]
MLAGVLVDVSASMSDALQLDTRLEDQSITRAESIFSTIISIVEREGGFQDDQEVFVLAFGLQVTGVNTCDLLALLDDVNRLNREYKTTGHAFLTQLLTENGAPYTGKFIEKYLSQQVAGNLFETFSQNRTLLKEIVQQLPLICKNAAAYNTYIAGEAAHSTGKNAYSTVQPVYSLVRRLILSSLRNDAPIVATTDSNVGYEESQAKKYIEQAIESSASIKLKTMLRPRKRPLDDVVTLLREVASLSDSSAS